MKLLPVALGAALVSAAAALAGAADDPEPAVADDPEPGVAADEGTGYELLVVGVYRPLDLEGRTVVEPREVYLQSVGVPAGPLSALIGRDLDVIRRAPLPAAVPLPAHAPTEPETAAPAEAADPPPPEAPPTDDGITRPTPAPIEAPRVATPVGRLQVTAVRGDVVVARVVHDGVDSTMHAEAEKPDGRPDLPAIMAGDLARYVEPPPPPAKPPPLSADEKARLEAEKQRLEQDDARRRVRPKPYERPVMRWKL